MAKKMKPARAKKPETTGGKDQTGELLDEELEKASGGTLANQGPIFKATDDKREAGGENIK
jgi:hypothetical protein